MGLMGLTPLLVYKFGRPQVRVLPSAPLIPLQMGMWRFLGLKPSAAPGVVLPAWAQISPFFFKKGFVLLVFRST
jgi:hypothetical protein